MERITNINQLQKGDKIAKISYDKVTVLEFVCIHPHSEEYSIFLNELYDGCPKFLNKNLKKEEWYRYKGQWQEIYDMQIEKLKERIDFTNNVKKRNNHG